jgi:hypothetical protein
MTDIPQDLNGKGSTGIYHLLSIRPFSLNVVYLFHPAECAGWYVLPRPEGKRCLVISSKGSRSYGILFAIVECIVFCGFIGASLNLTYCHYP